jgi:hypothetical protein
MGRYADFWLVTEAALRYTIRRLGLVASEDEVRRLMDAYLSLACFPEVKAALARLAGRPRAVLSNGAPSMLTAAVSSSGLAPSLEHVISVDRSRRTSPRRSSTRSVPRCWAWRPASSSSCPRTAGTWRARRRSATRSPGATAQALRRRSSAVGADLVVDALDQLPR